MPQEKEQTKRGPFTRGRLVVGLALVVAFGIGFLFRGGQDNGPAPAGDQQMAAAEPAIWTCSMHPQIKLPKAGQCPICFMDLIPLDSGDDDEAGPRTLVLSEAAIALADVQTAVVAAHEASASIKLIGQVAYDETRYRSISAWVAGRVDTLFVDYTGTRIERGDPLVSLYSPELYAAQAELLNAVRAERELRQSPDAAMRETAAATVSSARERLKLWGLAPQQIADIIRQEKPRDHLEIGSPLGGVVVHKNVMVGMYVQTGTRLYTVADLSRVWVTLSAYESDLAWLTEGQKVKFTVEALPGDSYSGQIVFIDPVLDSRKRTAEVRIAVDNRAGRLKPGMFVKAEVQAAVQAGLVEKPVVIPATAPLITGRRAVVYVQVPGQEKPTFEGREVVLGPRLGDYYVVRDGLVAGEIVVTRGNFKLDSALQIQAKPSMMNPAGGGMQTGHDHGMAPASGTTEEPFPGAAVAPVAVPGKFRDQLDSVLTAYLAVQEAMAADDDGRARSGAVAMRDALVAVEAASLEPGARMAWMSALPPLKELVAGLVAADGLADRREALRPLTTEFWPTLVRFGLERSQPIRLFHCPMAHDNAGADWIQMPSGTANPYFGASMLRCGSQIDSLGVGTAAEGQE